MKFIKRLFIWWDGQTVGTQFYTWRKGIKVGEDEQGNRFYRDKADERRWVVYNGDAEASRVTPAWHGWLHRTFDKPPTEESLPRQPWEKAHQENLTGSPMAYAPRGSLRGEPKEIEEYTAWIPK
ncbi:MAG: NADH:ubiquinone oxidoreductase subunit NDUFA12 [Albidovulum sp.]|nr:NADH:ubiquinone oxidoreductase subunit NDUFA12 [Albidovulum sp.]